MIHGIFDAKPVFEGVSNTTGSGTMDFLIPKDITAGLHLAKVQVDDTALEATCAVIVNTSKGN
jgi:hypothetical protein